MTPKEIKTRAERLLQQRANFEGLWSDIEKYIAPFQTQNGFSAITTVENAQKLTTTEIWDSTAQIGAERLGAAFYAGTVNNYQRWFRNAFRNPKLNQHPPSRQWLDVVSNTMWEALTSSNFGLEAATAFTTKVVFGTSCIYQELVNPKKWEGLQFTAVPLKEILFEEDWRGRVYCFYRFISWTATQIVTKLAPKESDEYKLLPEKIIQKHEQGADDRFEVIFCIYPREDAPAMKYGERVRAPEKRPYCACYVLRDSGEMLGKEDGYYEMPVYVDRYHKAPGTRWGYGPGTLALSTVKFLNAWMQAYLESGEKIVDPATLVTERGLLSDLDLSAGGLTTVRSMDDIKPYESAARFDVAATIIADLRDMIRRYFREDDLQLKDSPAMTATEAQIREARTNRVLAAPVGRVQNDLFDPMLQNTFNMMYREGQLPEPPQEVLRLSPEIQIEYLGPLMRSQRADDVAALERLASGVAALQKMGFQEVADVFNAQQLVREMAEFLSVPGSVLRDQREADALRAQRMQLQMAQAQAEIAKTAAEANRAQAGAEVED
jgi:hypothetical protein